MLHIILTILKITGILLLVLLLLVLCICLALLFVPLRYRLILVHTGEDSCGEAQVSWLLHLFFVRILLSLPNKEDAGFSRDSLQLTVRIFGIQPQKVAAFFKHRRKNNSSSKSRPQNAKSSESRKKTTEKQPVKKISPKNEKQTVKRNSSENEKQSEAKRDFGNGSVVQESSYKGIKQTAGKKSEQKDFKDKTSEEKDCSEKDCSEKDCSEKDFEEKDFEEKDFNSQPENKGFSKIFRRLLYKIRSIGGTIRKIPQRLQRWKQKLLKLIKKPGEWSRRLSALRQKIADYDAVDTVEEIWHKVKQTLRHFRVRKGKGYLRFGTGDPALTGELTGVLYLLLPVSCRKIQVEPQFTDAVLEMELDVAGHIRLIHIVVLAVWAFRNQKLRHLIRAFRRT
ncbi:MAG: DUF2953 domain-containing protein [Clostridiales bacterium]|nr:DUF2953 domain-containing protein [Clostridiales bacterium]